ncbi:MAG: polysaccharide deacetylase family protein [Burkholderiaceae bacterium]|nr:MAG: polysaccharide deacetylase family protein [Burkholderiaceae bacterium]
MNLLFRLVNQCLSPAGKNARLSILIYHRVLSQADPLTPDVPDALQFEKMMRALRASFNVLPLSEAVTCLQAGTLPARAACITFDDGYADNATVALPILQRLGLPAAVFVSPGFLNGGRMWNDTVIESTRRLPDGPVDLDFLNLPMHTIGDTASRRHLFNTVIHATKHLPPQERQQKVDHFAAQANALPNDLMMTDAQVIELHRKGIEIGAHTMTHPILSRIDNETAEREIRDSKLYLENLLQTGVDLFAYPNGKPVQDYLPQHARMVRALGFRAAVSTTWGVSTPASDPYQLPRFTPWEHDKLRFLARLALNQR